MPKTLELYRVRLEYKDVQAHKEWEKKAYNNHFDDPLPAPKITSYYAAVYPDYGGDPVKRAAELACEAVIGDPSFWKEWGVFVTEVKAMGSCAIEPEGGNDSA